MASASSSTSDVGPPGPARPTTAGLLKFMFTAGPARQDLGQPLALADLLTGDVSRLTARHADFGGAGLLRSLPARGLAFGPAGSPGSSSAASSASSAGPSDAEQPAAPRPPEDEAGPPAAPPQAGAGAEAQSRDSPSPDAASAAESSAPADPSAGLPSESPGPEFAEQQAGAAPARPGPAPEPSDEVPVLRPLAATQAAPAPAAAAFSVGEPSPPFEVAELKAQRQSRPGAGRPEAPEDAVREDARPARELVPLRQAEVVAGAQARAVPRPRFALAHSDLAARRLPSEQQVQTEQQPCESRARPTRSVDVQAGPAAPSAPEPAPEPAPAPAEPPAQAPSPQVLLVQLPPGCWPPLDAGPAEGEEEEESGEEDGAPAAPPRGEVGPTPARPPRDLNERFTCAFEIPADELKGGNRPRPAGQGPRDSTTEERNGQPRPWRSGPGAPQSAATSVFAGAALVRTPEPQRRALSEIDAGESALKDSKSIYYELDPRGAAPGPRPRSPVFHPGPREDLFRAPRRSPMTHRGPKEVDPRGAVFPAHLSDARPWRRVTWFIGQAARLFETTLEAAELRLLDEKCGDRSLARAELERLLLAAREDCQSILKVRNYLAIRRLPASEQAVLMAVWLECDEHTPRARVAQTLRDFDFDRPQRALAAKIAEAVLGDDMLVFGSVQELLALVLRRLPALREMAPRWEAAPSPLPVEYFPGDGAEAADAPAPEPRAARRTGPARRKARRAPPAPLPAPAYFAVPPAPQPPPERAGEGPEAPPEQAPRAAPADAEPPGRPRGAAAETQTNLILSAAAGQAAGPAEQTRESGVQAAPGVLAETLDLDDLAPPSPVALARSGPARAQTPTAPCDPAPMSPVQRSLEPLSEAALRGEPARRLPGRASPEARRVEETYERTALRLERAADRRRDAPAPSAPGEDRAAPGDLSGALRRDGAEPLSPRVRREGRSIYPRVRGAFARPQRPEAPEPAPARESVYPQLPARRDAPRPERPDGPPAAEREEARPRPAEDAGRAEDARAALVEQILDGLLASPGSPGQAIPTAPPQARAAPLQALGPADLQRRADDAPGSQVQQSLLPPGGPAPVLTRGCPRFERQIAPDALYFGPGEARRVRFSTTVAGIEYAQDPAERRWFGGDDPGWPGEDMEGS